MIANDIDTAEASEAEQDRALPTSGLIGFVRGMLEMLEVDLQRNELATLAGLTSTDLQYLERHDPQREPLIHAEWILSACAATAVIYTPIGAFNLDLASPNQEAIAARRRRHCNAAIESGVAVERAVDYVEGLGAKAASALAAPLADRAPSVQPSVIAVASEMITLLDVRPSNVEIACGATTDQMRADPDPDKASRAMRVVHRLLSACGCLIQIRRGGCTWEIGRRDPHAPAAAALVSGWGKTGVNVSLTEARGGTAHDMTGAIIDCLSQGQSIVEVADILGTSKQNISAMIHRAGYDARGLRRTGQRHAAYSTLKACRQPGRA